MNNRQWDTMNESAWEELLRDSIPALPPEDVVKKVTPWKRAMNRILIGWALGTITLNFWCLDTILSSIGMVLTLLGFRTLRQENRWLQTCFVLTVVLASLFFPLVILDTMPIQSTVHASPAMLVVTAINTGLELLRLFSLWRGLRAVQEKTGLPPNAKGALALLIWFMVLCLLGLVQYSGFFLSGLLLVAYFRILRSLWKLSRELDEAGYAVQTTPVKVPDRAVALVICTVVVIGCACGYLFGGKYPMNWQVSRTTEHSGVEDIKEHLLELGFPAYVLNDLTVEDIVACKDARQVIVDVEDHPMNNNGRTVTMREVNRLGEWRDVARTVYDVKELRLTGVGVQLPGEQEQWVVIHHFLWTTNPGFYGTEVIQLQPTYRSTLHGWDSAGDVTGRVLYDKDGTTYAAPYYSLGEHTFTSNHILLGEQTSTDVFATFSMPYGGENHRGYIAYPISEVQEGWSIDSWLNYTHQRTWMQYPAVTAIEKRIAVSSNNAGAFKTAQGVLRIFFLDRCKR